MWHGRKPPPLRQSYENYVPGPTRVFDGKTEGEKKEGAPPYVDHTNLSSRSIVGDSSIELRKDYGSVGFRHTLLSVDQDKQHERWELVLLV
jgi:hypothetical protein